MYLPSKYVMVVFDCCSQTSGYTGKGQKCRKLVGEKGGLSPRKRAKFDGNKGVSSAKECSDSPKNKGFGPNLGSIVQ